VYEPVSTSKCNKILYIDCLHELYAMKPNLEELFTMCNFLREKKKKPKLKVTSDVEDIKHAASYIIKHSIQKDAHLQYLLVSIGDKGVLVCELKGTDKQNVNYTLYKPEKINDIINVNGAGDCFVGGFVFGMVNKMKVEDSVKAGLVCSGMSLRSQENVSPDLHSSVVLSKIRNK